MASLLAGSFTLPAWAGEVRIKSLEVNRNLKVNVPYEVTLPYVLSGSGRIQQVCFFWSSDGPYCFGADFNDKRAKIELNTGRASTYELSAYIRYRSNGRQQESNRVSKTIAVKR
ncbi:MAG: hypothetical protein AAFY73_12790 [Pseudomonadota bacterium]